MKRLLLTTLLLLTLGLAALIAPASGQTTPPPEPTLLLVLHTSGVCELSPDESVLAVNDGVYGLPDGTLQFPVRGQAHRGSMPVFSLDGRYVFIPADGVFETATGREVYDTSASHGVLSPDGSAFYFGMAGRFNVVNGAWQPAPTPAPSFRDPIYIADMLPGTSDGGGVSGLVAGDGQWRAIEGRGLFRFGSDEPVVPLGSVESMAWNADETLFTVATLDSVSVYAMSSGALLMQIPLPPRPQVPETGDWFFTVGAGVYPDGTLQIGYYGGRQVSYEELQRLSNSAYAIYTYSYPDGALLHTQGGGPGIYSADNRFAARDDGIYDTANGDLWLPLPVFKSYKIKFSPDSTLAAIRQDGVYDLATRQNLYSLSKFDFEFSPDSRWLYSKRTGVIDSRTGDVRLSLTGGEGVFTASSRYFVWRDDASCAIYRMPEN